jgi:NitT/TauT family transport system substrate-binding protein
MSKAFLFPYLGILCCAVGTLLISGCSDAKKFDANQTAPESKDSKAPKRDKVILQLNWYPEAEHGGFYAAKVHGLYEAKNLDVEIRPGGKTTVVPQELTLGRIQFGVANADDVVLAREQSAPLVALMAPLQIGPRCIMVREDSGISSFEDLENITLQIDPSRPYVPFMKSKGLLSKGVKTVPYFGSVAQLVADKRTAQQAYSFSEPLMAEQAGVKVKTLMMSDIGYNPYASLLIASEDFVSKNEDITKRMVVASVQGWQKYLESPEETNKYILSQNQQGMTAEALSYGVTNLKPLCLPEGFDPSNLGAMSSERWQTLVEQLASLKEMKMTPGKVKPEECFNAKFLEPAVAVQTN